MQKTHYNTINTTSEIKISVLAPQLDLIDNIGGLFRICDAMGVNCIYFGHEVNFNSRKLKRAARSTQKIIDYHTNVNSKEIINNFIGKEHIVIGLELTNNSSSIQQLSLKKNSEILLVIGNEIEGIPDDLLLEIPKCYHIDMYGANSSMNVIQATSIALYQIHNGLLN